MRGSIAEDEVRWTWYKVVHDTMSTNLRLGTRWCTTPCLRTYVYIRLSCSLQLRVFTVVRQTPLHSLTACTEINAMWAWTRGKLATILRTDPKHIPTTWVSAPIFIFATTQASDSVMNHRSRGTTLCRQKTILQPSGLNGLYEAIEVACKTESE